MCKRLFKIIKLNGCPTQFGSSLGVGCQDIRFVVKTALQDLYKHNIPTSVAFVDLAKASDMLSHSMMLNILEQYGSPPKLRHATARMYADLKIVLKIVKAKAYTGQKVGVRKGDCMAPILLYFMIMEFSETLNISWKQLGHKMITFNMRTNSPRDRGSLTRQAPQTFYKGNILDLFNVLYVDYGAFPFDYRDQLTKGVQLIYDHFKRYGLKMHIGKGAKSSKTECVFFLLPVFFKRKRTLPAMENRVNEAILDKTNSV